MTRATGLPRRLLLLLVLDAAGAEPLAARAGGEAHAGEVEPLDGTLGVVAAHHVAVGHLAAGGGNSASLYLRWREKQCFIVPPVVKQQCFIVPPVGREKYTTRPNTIGGGREGNNQ